VHLVVYLADLMVVELVFLMVYKLAVLWDL